MRCQYARIGNSASGIERAVWTAALFAVSVGLTGCMTVTVNNYATGTNSRIEVTTSQPKTVTTTADATVPATALGL
jgi:hypothetical protein